MRDATPTPTKGQALKNMLELLFHSPEKFDASPICHPKTLSRILGEQYAALIADNLSPRDLAVNGLKQITAQRIVEAVQQDDQRLAEGLVLIWHQYLAPILSGSARSISPVARVLIYCAQPDNLGGMWTEIEKMQESSSRAIQRIPLFRDITDNGHGIEHSAKKQRRTYANYIQRAFETLGKADELAGIGDAAAVTCNVEIGAMSPSTPDVEIPYEEIPELAVQPSILRILVAHILKHCHHLPLACGRTLPTSWAIERAIEARSVKGEALRPNVAPGTADDVKRMSGVLVGVPGSGRTSFLYRIAYSWANAYLRTVNG